MRQTNKKRRLFEDDEIFGTTDVIPLSKVPKDAAKAAVGAGKDDGSDTDDVAGTSKATLPASQMRASQTQIIPEKAFAMACSMMLQKGPFKGPGGELGSIVSNDKPAYIMDGHHRWAATYLCDPGATISATQIELPGKALVSALNVVTVGKYNRGGNSGEGDIKSFTGATLEKVIEDFKKNGYTDDKGNKTTPEDVVKTLKLLGDDDEEKGKKTVMANADKLPKDIMPGAPPRVEMPVIDSDEVKTVASAIAAGEIDIKKPYADDVKTKGKFESYYNTRRGLKPLKKSVIDNLLEYNKKNKKRLQESYVKKVKKQKLQEKLVNILKPLVKEAIKSMIKK